MDKDLTVKKAVRLHASITDVWEALTNPQITKRYFFNCEAISEWAVGSPIVFNMMVDGTETAVVKGVVTAVEPRSLLQHTCFTPEAENDESRHTTVTYSLESDAEVTTLTVTQGRFNDEETYAHTQTSWDTVLGGLKALLEDRA